MEPVVDYGRHNVIMNMKNGASVAAKSSAGISNHSQAVKMHQPADS
jgi:hypothetical protein